MNRYIPIVFALCLSLGFQMAACASLPVKQTAVVSLQASEAALADAQTIERAYCFNSPATEAGTHCTNPQAATLHLTDDLHVKMAQGFSFAFGLEIKAATALQAWQAGQPAPTDLAGYQADISAILATAQVLDPGASPLVAKIQTSVNSAAAVASALGVK